MNPTGAYDAERASALSGVPKSTIHYWARHSVLEPSVSAERVKLWSYADLMGLRVIYWLRQRKTDAAGAEIPRTSMPSIRHALRRMQQVDVPLWDPEEHSLWVDAGGEIYLRGPGGPETRAGQRVVADALHLTAPFATREGLRGPDLVRPRTELRIAPGRLSGSPHIVHTRLETRALRALERDGLEVGTIASLYPFVTRRQIDQALDLERQLDANVGRAA